MDAVRIIGGAIIIFGWFSIRWSNMTRSTRAMRLAREHGLSYTRVAEPYDRFGVSAQCEIWTLFGALIGGLVGAGAGWAYLGSVALGIVFGLAGAIAGGWRYRVTTSILLAAEGRPSPEPARMHVRVSGSPLQWAFAGVGCGVVIGLVVGPAFDQHGTTLIVETFLAAAYLAWNFTKFGARGS